MDTQTFQLSNLKSSEEVVSYFDSAWTELRNEAMSRDLMIISTLVAFMLLLHYIAYHNQTILSSKLPLNCGISDVKSSSLFDWRIVGGSGTKLGEFPWQVLIVREYTSFGEDMLSLCGGTIINENWILTAAHCTTATDATTYKIFLGKNKLNESENTASVALAEKIVQHKGYDSDTVRNDIGLIKLRTAIDFERKQKFLHPICLATATTNLTNKCYALGWGDRSSKGEESKQLLKVYEPLYNMSSCVKNMVDVDVKTNICAGGSHDGGSGTCSGDSGGPLQCAAADGKWFQVGITSWGIPCARPGFPDIFTKVSAYISWIVEVISKD